MPNTTTTDHVATDRIVYTYQRDGWPQGVLTGYVNEAGGFVLEHVMPFGPRYLLGLVGAGLAYAWTRDWPYVLFHIPVRHPHYTVLTMIGRRLGFEEYAPSFWVKYKEKA